MLVSNKVIFDKFPQERNMTVKETTYVEAVHLQLYCVGVPVLSFCSFFYFTYFYGQLPVNLCIQSEHKKMRNQKKLYQHRIKFHIAQHFTLFPDVEILCESTVSPEFWANRLKLYGNWAFPQNYGTLCSTGIILCNVNFEDTILTSTVNLLVSEKRSV